MRPNSESRVISVALKLIKKQFPNLKGVVSYADTEQNHKGTIYRAANFSYKGLTSKKTDLFIKGKKVGKVGGFRLLRGKGEWLPRSQKHLYVYFFDRGRKELVGGQAR